MSSTNETHQHYVLQYGCAEVGRYFRGLVESERRQGRIPVRYGDNHGEHFIWVEADDHGFPRFTTIRFAEWSHASLEAVEELPAVTVQPTEKTLYVHHPVLVHPDPEDFNGKPYVFMWHGEVQYGRRDKFAKECTVEELLKMAQQKVVERNPQILDTAQKNRPIK